MKTSGLTDAELLAVHHTRLAGWVLQRVGAAMLLGTAVTIGLLILAAALQSSDWVLIAPVVGLLTFGGYLATGQAPPPPWEE